MRVKFIVSPDYNFRGRIVNPAYWFLRSYYKFSSKNYDKITWLDAHFQFLTDNDAMINTIIEEKVDVLCMSIYIWNREQYLTIAKKVKELNPNIIIIAGGPELDAYKNPDFWNENSQLDYVVYGDGEFAFKVLLDHLVDGTSLEDAVNIVTKEKIYPFKIFTDKEFSKISPWLEMEDDIMRVIKEANGETLLFNWEMSRGCPYSCSFCDWSSGLHNKVKRRKGNWREEIDLFAKINVNVGIIDANWGQFPEDIEIHQYAVDKLGDKLWTQNFSKLNKKTVYEMIKIQGRGRESTFKTNISLQDINPEVLKNIDRPEVPWEEHRKFIIELLENNPNIQATPELIVGLPGQTPDSFMNTITELHDIGVSRITHHGWVLLTNSPANNIEYQEKHKIKIENLIWLANTIFPDRQSALVSANNKDNKTFIAKTIVGTYSCDLADILTMHSFAGLYNSIMHFNPKLNPLKIINRNRQRIIDMSNQHAEIMNNDKIFGIENYTGFVDYKNLWEYYDKNNFNRMLKDI